MSFIVEMKIVKRLRESNPRSPRSATGPSRWPPQVSTFRKNLMNSYRVFAASSGLLSEAGEPLAPLLLRGIRTHNSVRLYHNVAVAPLHLDLLYLSSFFTLRFLKFQERLKFDARRKRVNFLRIFKNYFDGLCSKFVATILDF